MRYATSKIRNLVILTSSFFLLSACGQQTSPTKTEATKQDTAVSKDSTKTEDTQKTEDSAKAENNAKTENNVKTESNAKTENNTKTENSTTTKNNAKSENSTKTENNTKPEAESKNTQKEQQPAKQPNKQTDTITFTSEDAIKVLEKRMGARSNEIRYGSSEDKLIGTINGIKLYDVLYGRESPENSRALNFAVGSDGNLYDWSKAQDGILQPLNGN
ncbi:MULTISPECIES: hypothetical protein [Bacillus]|uniref:Lipoprotein n=1 Tax=Bacillus wiedmannii TaxID=1890302 RepID=A0A2B5IXD7_9BACI|nr:MULTISPECIES: hypothetical protein [Bacillus]MDF9662073.1 hypothetical protein [Bacillus wiedmannii]PFZ29938.1 hypothetical protein COL51_01545 [Bacillus wiedmannii]PGC13121.1 hypothetical protein COM08_27305 [Bacillus wiedmannii]PGC58723.1 hypothetical protein COM22_10485 [Bacillus wiedmannii]PGD37828.1 hypothetical protein COM27_09140 [Bacillus wiedmannii]